jgi:hypothetical protein
MKSISSRNVIWLAFVLAALLSFAYFYFQPISLSRKLLPTINQPPTEIKEKAIRIISNERSVSSDAVDKHISPKAIVIEQNLTILGTPAEAAEIKQWYRDRGRFFANHDVEYKNYDELTLRKLADTGDIRALHALADLYIDDEHFGLEGYGLEATNDLFWKAAAYGSTEALYQLALNMETLKYSSTGPELENRKYVLEILSLYNTAALRGDEMPNLVSAKAFKFLNHINLSSEEKRFIEQRSQEIYNQLLQKRIELGLGNFDNSQPESVKKYFARLREAQSSD